MHFRDVDFVECFTNKTIFKIFRLYYRRVQQSQATRLVHTFQNDLIQNYTPWHTYIVLHTHNRCL